MSFNYTENMLLKNKGIIDTCSLMNDGLMPFIEKHKDFMISHNIKIILHDKIIAELKNHIMSVNIEKSLKAKRAVKIINENSDLFETINSNNDQFINSFADPTILSELVKNKPYCNQLLISNDAALTGDAYEFLNNLNSVSGKPVYVCYLGKDGDFHKCDCVNNQCVKDNSCKEPIVVEKPVEVIVEKPIYITKEVTNKNGILLGVAIGTTGTMACIYRKPIIRSLAKIGKQLISLAY